LDIGHGEGPLGGDPFAPVISSQGREKRRTNGANNNHVPFSGTGVEIRIDTKDSLDPIRVKSSHNRQAGCDGGKNGFNPNDRTNVILTGFPTLCRLTGNS
jgi:hypothetical protein